MRILAVEPIIQSFLDMDFYKLTMGQIAWRKFFHTHVRYAFRNRTKNIKLADYIDEQELRAQLDLAAQLKPNTEELVYLRESRWIPKGFFRPAYLDFLRAIQFSEYELIKKDDTYEITVEGRWANAIWWETIILSIVNELYYRGLLKKRGIAVEEAWAEGEYRLMKKIEIIKIEAPRLVDFGTRRRFSSSWQEHVVRRLKSELPDDQLFLGISNVHLAKKYGLKPTGTFAHEVFMICAGRDGASDEGICATHNKVLQDWWDLYGESMSIALTDTFGTEFFFKDFTLEQAQAWRGLRQDSGDPFNFGEKAIAFYKQLGVDPRSKIIVFSDGLDIDMIVALHRRFNGEIGVAFGWGTNLTNDLGFSPLSLIVKPTHADSNSLVKLSDNLAKAMGEPAAIERYKKIFGYSGYFHQDCKY